MCEFAILVSYAIRWLQPCKINHFFQLAQMKYKNMYVLNCNLMQNNLYSVDFGFKMYLNANVC